MLQVLHLRTKLSKSAEHLLFVARFEFWVREIFLDMPAFAIDTVLLNLDQAVARSFPRIRFAKIRVFAQPIL